MTTTSESLSAQAEAVQIGLGRRIWLQDRGEPIFGIGICRLLVRVEATGSLRCAAVEMGMAYSKAWQVVRRAEEHLGFALTYRQVGGKRGGGSVLSDDGKRLVASFVALTDEAGPILDRLYESHFGTWPGTREDRQSSAPARVSPRPAGL